MFLKRSFSCLEFGYIVTVSTDDCDECFRTYLKTAKLALNGFLPGEKRAPIIGMSNKCPVFNRIRFQCK